MAKTSAIIFGIIFVIAGIWGFFANPILGFLAADSVSSIIHIIAGLVLLIVAAKPAAASALKTIGIIYVVFAILGFLQTSTVLFGVFTTSMASNWFYLVVGIIVAALGWSSAKGGMSSAAPAM